MGSDFAYTNYPEDWVRTTLGEMIRQSKGSIQTGPFGSQLHAADYVEIGIPSVMPKNISIEGIVEQDIARITQEDADRLKKYLLEEGDIIYSRRGDVEKCALVKQHETGWLCGTGCLRVRLGNESHVTPEFLHAYLSTPAIREWVSRNAIGATMPNLNTTILSDIPVILPNSSSIQLIGNIWHEINQKITLNRQINQTLEQMAQTLFKSWFVDFDPVIDNALDAGNDIPDTLQERAEQRRLLRAKADFKPLPAETRALFPSEFEETELGWVPKGWDISTTGDEFEVKGGSTPSTANPEFWDEGTIHWTSPKDLSDIDTKILLDTSRKITEAGLKKITSGLLPENTVLMSSRAPVGYLALAKIPVAINQGYIAIPSAKNFTAEYIIQWLDSNMDQIKGMAGGTTFAEISKSTFKTIEILVPTKPVIVEFTKMAKATFDKITSNVKESSYLSNIRDSLLPKLISGELALDDLPEDVAEAAEAL